MDRIRSVFYDVLRCPGNRPSLIQFRFTESTWQRMADPNPPPSASHWLALAGVCLGVFMFALDGSIVNIAVPTLVRELQASLTDVQWVIQAYLGAVVLLLLPLACFARRIGQKRLFLSGLFLFTTGSFLCGSADTVESLIGFRIVQAVGAASIAALMSSIVGALFPPGRLAQALGIVAATATLGASLGPTIGGFLINAGSWHFIFLVNVPVGVTAFVLVWVTLPRPAPTPESSERFSWRETLALFKEAGFRNGIGGRLACMMANGAFLFLTPLFLENALHYPTAKAGLFLAASPILIGATSPLFGALADRFGRTRFLLSGQVCMVGGLLVMHTFSATMSEGAFLLKVALWGIGVGMFNAPNAAGVMAAAPKRLADGVSALLSLSIILGQLLGVAAGGTLFRWFAFGDNLPHGSSEIIGLEPAVLAAAVANSLPIFALPLLVILASCIIYKGQPRSRGVALP